MIALSLATAALADDRALPHGFVPPGDLPLFTRAGHGEGKGTAKGDDCPGAVQAALADLGKDGRVLAVDGDGTLVCKQRKAGDAVSASLVELSGWWIAPGAGAAVPAERQLALAKVLTSMLPEGAPVALEPGPAGTAWLLYPTVAPEGLPVLPEPADRAAHAFEAWVSEWIPRWVSLAGAVPELAGGRLSVAWPAEKAKNGTLRFDVPKDVAARWYGGNIGDDVLVQGMEIGWSPDPRKVPFQKLSVDVEAGEPRSAPAPEPTRQLDVKEEDLEGLQDEAP